MEARLTNDPKIEVRTKLVGYWGQALLSWHVGIFWDLYWFAKTGGLRSDHGGQAHKWSWNRGQDKTSILLRLGTSKLACGDHLGSILICQNRRTQKWPWRPDDPEIEVRTKILSYWGQERSPHANLEIPGHNKTLVLSWPLFQDHLWAWPPWSLLSSPVLANQYGPQKISTCQLWSAWTQ